jgi:hypothetical protein
MSEEGDGPKPPKRFTSLRKWIETFFLQLYHTNLFFWLPGESGPGKSLLLSTFAGAIIVYARRTHADYAAVAGTPTVVGAVLLGSIICSFSVCLFDPKLRTDQAKYLMNSGRCYQLIAVGVLLSASAISANRVWPWSEKISYRFSLDGFDEIAWAFAGPAALFSFLVILSLSSLRIEFREAAKSDPIRAVAWSAVMLAIIFVVNLTIFDFGKQSSFGD